MKTEKQTYTFKIDRIAFEERLHQLTYWNNRQNPLSNYVFRGKSNKEGFNIQVNKFGIEMPKPRIQGKFVNDTLQISIKWRFIVINHTIGFILLWLVLAPLLFITVIDNYANDGFNIKDFFIILTCLGSLLYPFILHNIMQSDSRKDFEIFKESFRNNLH